MGSNLGRSADDISSVTVGGITCTSVTFVSSAELECVAPGFGFEGSDVVVYHGSVPSLGGEGKFSASRQPVISSIWPKVAPSSANPEVTIFGADFPTDPDDVDSITIGVFPCRGISVISPAEMRCRVSPGTGAGHRVGMMTAGGFDELESTAVFSFSAPAVSRVVPGFAYAVGVAGTESFMILGSNMGPAGAPPPAARVGGIPCSNTTRINQTAVLCSLSNVSSWPGAAAAVVVDGQGGSLADAIRVQPLPVVSLLLPGGGPTRGDTEVTVTGAGWGPSETDLVSVWVGTRRCAKVVWESGSRLRATVPAGTGVDHGVHVVTRRNGNSSKSPGPLSVFSYDAPRVTNITPQWVFSGNLSALITLAGENLGHDGSVVPQVRVGHAACDVAAWSHEFIRCALAMQSFGPSTTVEQIALQVDGQNVTNAVTLEVIGQPVALSSDPRVIPVQGFRGLRVVGESFGKEPDDVMSVSVGPYACNVTSWSPSRLELNIPPGAGAGHELVVLTRGGRRNAEPPLVSFRQAEIDSVSPEYTFLGKTDQAFVIKGRQLGASATDLTSASVGGNDCTLVRWISSTEIVCEGTVGATWPTRRISVTVGNQAANSSDIFVGLGRPEIRRVSPIQAEEGETVTLLGRNLGRKLEDILDIRVGRLGADLATAQVISESAVSFLMPLKPPDLLALAENDPMVLSELQVTITTAGGLSSDGGGAGTQVSYFGAGQAVSEQSKYVAGWRPPGISSELQLRWAFRQDNASSETLPLTAFEVVTRAVTSSSSVPAAGSNDTGDGITESKRVDDIRMTRIDTTEGLVVYSYSTLAFSRAPLQVRIRAQNPTGFGPWTNWSEGIPEACAMDRFLQTHLPRQEDQVCEACPPGAFCGGGTSAEVTAMPGFWRVPWSPNKLGFRKCPFPQACLGYAVEPGPPPGSPSQDNSTAEGGALTNFSSSFPTLNSTLAQLSRVSLLSDEQKGRPLEQEGCAPGYSGVLCASCVPGFTSNAQGCARCPEPWTALLQIAGIAVGIGMAAAWLVSGALSTNKKLSSNKVPALRITFSHLQTIAIAASFDIQWPIELLTMFEGMDSSTSVTAVVSTECITPRSFTAAVSPGGSQFFINALVIVASPLILFVLASTYWLGMVPLARAAYGCARAVCGRHSGGGRKWRPPPQESMKPRLHTTVTNPMAAADRKEAAGSHVRAPNRSPSFAKARKSVRSEPAGQASQWSRLLVNLQVTVTVLLFASHMSVTKTSLRLLTCYDVLADGQTEPMPQGTEEIGDSTLGQQGFTDACSQPWLQHRRLLADPNVCCNDPATWTVMQLLGFPGIVLFALGIPIVAMVAMTRLYRKDGGESMSRQQRPSGHQGGQRKSPLHSEDGARKYGFLTKGFKQQAYFWECVVMLRKVVVAAIAVFMAPLGVTTQVYASLLLIFALGLVQASLRPYKDSLLNALELSGLVCAFVTMLGGLFLGVGSDSSSVKIPQLQILLMTWLVIAANAGFLVFAASVALTTKKTFAGCAAEFRRCGCFGRRHAGQGGSSWCHKPAAQDAAPVGAPPAPRRRSRKNAKKSSRLPGSQRSSENVPSGSALSRTVSFASSLGDPGGRGTVLDTQAAGPALKATAGIPRPQARVVLASAAEHRPGSAPMLLSGSSSPQPRTPKATVRRPTMPSPKTHALRGGKAVGVKPARVRRPTMPSPAASTLTSGSGTIARPARVRRPTVSTPSPAPLAESMVKPTTPPTGRKVPVPQLKTSVSETSSVEC